MGRPRGDRAERFAALQHLEEHRLLFVVELEEADQLFQHLVLLGASEMQADRIGGEEFQ